MNCPPPWPRGHISQSRGTGAQLKTELVSRWTWGYSKGTLHDLGMGSVWTHLSCSVEFVIRKMVREQMTLKFLRNQTTAQLQPKPGLGQQ